MVVAALLLSRLCEDEALSRTQQARYAVVGAFCNSLLLVMGNVSADRYHIRLRVGGGDM